MAVGGLEPSHIRWEVTTEEEPFIAHACRWPSKRASGSSKGCLTEGWPRDQARPVTVGSASNSLSALRALAHPLRLRILSLLAADEPYSAAEVSRILGCTHANASYHLRTLLAAGLLEVDHVAKVQGGQAVRYRYSAGAVTEGETVLGDHMLAATALSSELQRRVMHRDDRDPGYLSDAELWVYPDDFDDFRAQLHEAVGRLHRRARPRRSPGCVVVSVTAVAFRLRAQA